MPDSHDPVVLRHAGFEAVISPHVGGSIARLTRRTAAGAVELLRPTDGVALSGGGPNDFGCFPLVPFSNRVAAGRFRFQGRTVELPLNRPGCPHAIHGHAWESPWTVEGRSDGSLRLAYRHAADQWPWSYRATQIFTLGEHGLTVDLELVNEGDGPMPAGIGLHPYFPKPPGTVLTAGVRTVWLTDAGMLPVQRACPPPEWDFPTGRVMDDCVIDNGFAGWDGRAVVAWPDGRGRLVLEAEGPFGHLVVYAPRGGDFVCVEPVTHMTDAVNHPHEPDAGVRVLDPGDRLTGRIRFRHEMA
jgi:aldose 1-epimerase